MTAAWSGSRAPRPALVCAAGAAAGNDGGGRETEPDLPLH